jgi:hypothetical protein
MSYDLSLSNYHKKTKSKKKGNITRIGIDTPIGQIELGSDAFHGAMKPDILSSSANRGGIFSQHLEKQDVEDGGITHGDCYKPDEASSCDFTENINRNKSQRKHKKYHRSRRNSGKGTK